jgi:hypothetical protein
MSEGVAALQDDGPSYDIVITDMSMEEGNSGLAMLKAATELGRRAEDLNARRKKATGNTRFTAPVNSVVVSVLMLASSYAGGVPAAERTRLLPPVESSA